MMLINKLYLRNIFQRVLGKNNKSNYNLKRKQGRPKATWRRTAEKEIKAMGLTWGETEMIALDRIGWRQRVEYTCLKYT